MELRNAARHIGPIRVGLVAADEVAALTAVYEAMRLGLALPRLLGDGDKIQKMAYGLGLEHLAEGASVIGCSDPASTAVEMAGNGDIDVIMKGHIRTDQLIRAVLNAKCSLRVGRLLSDVLLYEDKLSGECRLVGITDGGLNISPTATQKEQIIQNAIEVFHCLGVAEPKIAVMSATEVVSSNMQSTTDAAILTGLGRKGVFGTAEVFGPLALDNALLTSAARAKEISSSVAGRADCLIVPTIEAGNLLGKAVKYFGGSPCAHIVVGAKIPVLIPSRVENAEDKLNAIALGALYGTR